LKKDTATLIAERDGWLLGLGLLWKTCTAFRITREPIQRNLPAPVQSIFLNGK